MYGQNLCSLALKPRFHMIAAIAEKKKFRERNDHSDDMETTFQRSAQRQRSLR